MAILLSGLSPVTSDTWPYVPALIISIVKENVYSYSFRNSAIGEIGESCIFCLYYFLSVWVKAVCCF